MSTSTSIVLFNELKQALEQLSFPSDYYDYLINHGIENLECLDLIIKDKHTSFLDKIPFDRFIMIRNRIKKIVTKNQIGILLYVVFNKSYFKKRRSMLFLLI